MYPPHHRNWQFPGRRTPRNRSGPVYERVCGAGLVPVHAADLVHSKDHTDALQRPEEVQVVPSIALVRQNERPSPGASRLAENRPQPGECQLHCAVACVMVAGRLLALLRIGSSRLGGVEERIVRVRLGVRVGGLLGRRVLFGRFLLGASFLAPGHGRGESDQSRAIHGWCVARGIARGQSRIRPTAGTRALTGEEALFDQIQRILHRNAVFTSHPDAENGELRVRIVVADAGTGTLALCCEHRLSIFLDVGVKLTRLRVWLECLQPLHVSS